MYSGTEEFLRTNKEVGNKVEDNNGRQVRTSRVLGLSRPSTAVYGIALTWRGGFSRRFQNDKD